MADKPEKTNITQAVIHLPGMAQVPVVAIKLPDGTIALRHPSELIKSGPMIQKPGGGS